MTSTHFTQNKYFFFVIRLVKYISNSKYLCLLNGRVYICHYNRLSIKYFERKQQPCMNYVYHVSVIYAAIRKERVISVLYSWIEIISLI